MPIDCIATVDQSIGHKVEHQERAYVDQLNYNVKLSEKRNECCAKSYTKKRKRDSWFPFRLCSYIFSF